MPDPHIYPDGLAPLTLATGVGAATVIEQLASNAGSINGDFFMYLRLAMSDPAGALPGAVTLPDIILQVDAGAALNPLPITGSSQSIYSGPPSGATYIADVSMLPDPVFHNNVWVVSIDFNPGTFNAATPHKWTLTIKNNDASTRDFTWVVSATQALTSQPWIDVSPTQLSWDALINQTAGESVQITNRGTAAFTINGVTPALPAAFTLGALPGSLIPGDSQPLTVTFGPLAAPPAPNGSSQANATVTITPPDNTAAAFAGHNNQLSLSAITQGLEVVLLLDDSGSMTWDPKGNTLTAAQQNLSRWSELKDAVNNQFLPLVGQFGFDTTTKKSYGTLAIARFPALDPSTPTTFDLVNPPLAINAANITTATNAVGAVTPFFAGTPMGDGLNRVVVQAPFFASDALSVSANRRWLLLMTDGAQNIGTHQPSEFILPAKGGTAAGATDLVTQKISLYAIGYGVTGFSNVDPVVLQSLADSSYNGGGVGRADDAPLTGTQIAAAFRTAIKSGITPGSSPGDPPAVFLGGQGEARYSALITPYDRKAAFVLGWNTPDANRMRLELLTPTCDVLTPEAVEQGEFPGVTFVGGNRSQMYLIDPKFLNDSTTSTNRYGTWTLRILGLDLQSVGVRAASTVNRQDTENYDYDVILDSDLRMNLKLDSSPVFAGDPIGVTARLLAAGKPIRNAAVTLSTTAPRQSEANWLAALTVPADALKQATAKVTGDSSQLLVKTVAAGLAGFSFPGGSDQTNMGMTDPGGVGTYRATVTNTSTPEAYTFYVTAIGVTDDGNSFRREGKIVTNVLVRPDPAFTRLDVQFGAAGTAQAIVVPRDRFGNVLLLDPSTSGLFGLTIQNGTFTSPLISNLDGTYSRGLKFDPGASPVIGVTFGGQTIQQQPLPPVGKLIWVNEVLAFVAGAEAAKGANLHSNPSDVLGDVQNKPAGTFVSLGSHGVLSVDVKGQVIQAQGSDDVTVFVHPDSDLRSYSVAALPATAHDSDADDWVMLGTSPGITTSFGLSAAHLSAARAIRITDTSGRARGTDSKPLSTPGVSIRAVGVKKTSAGQGDGGGGDGDTCIRLQIVNSQHKPLGGTVKIDFQPQDAGRAATVESVDASKDIDVSRLSRTPQGLYEVTVTPTSVFKPTSQFVTIPASGFVTVVFVIDE